MARLSVPPEVPVAVEAGDSEERVVKPSGVAWLRRLSRRTWITVVAVLVVAGIAAFVALRDPGPLPLTRLRPYFCA